MHRFTIEPESGYTGKFHLNPAKAERMYFLAFYRINEIKKAGIVK